MLVEIVMNSNELLRKKKRYFKTNLGLYRKLFDKIEYEEDDKQFYIFEMSFIRQFKLSRK